MKDVGVFHGVDFDEKVMDSLFEKIVAICPAFRAAYQTQNDFENAKREWLIGFKDVGLTDLKQIQVGVNKLRMSESPFVPSFGQFVKLCQPLAADMGMPAFENAYTEACKNSSPYEREKKWSHPVIRYTVRQLSTHFISNNAESVVRPRFEKAYEDSCRRFMAGELREELVQMGYDFEDLLKLEGGKDE